MRPEAKLRGRLGEDGKSSGPGKLGDRRPELGVRLPPADDQSTFGFREIGGDGVELCLGESGGWAVDCAQRQIAAPFQGKGRGGDHVALARLGSQRVAPRQVQVDWAGANVPSSGCHRVARGRAHVDEARVVRVMGSHLAEPSDR